MATLRSFLFLAFGFSILNAQPRLPAYVTPANVTPATPETFVTTVPSHVALFHVEISPNSSKASLPTIGLVGLWVVGICNNSPVSATVQRTAILAAAPALHAMPDNLAQDLMTRKVGTSPWSVTAAILKELGIIVPMGVAAQGLANNSKTTAYAGIGAAVGMYLVSRATARVPNPTPYFAELLPAAVTLGPLQCSTAPYFLIADLMKQQPGTISLDMTVPQLP